MMKSKKNHDTINGGTITRRDAKLFEHLRKTRCLSQQQIETLLGLKPGGFRRRLAVLAKRKYLQKVPYGTIGGKYIVAWTTGSKLANETRPFGSKHLYELEHQLGLNQIYVDLVADFGFADKFHWQDGNLNPISFLSEKIVPDAVLSTASKGGKWLIEYDRATKSIERLKEQIKKYREYFSSPFSSCESLLFSTTKSARKDIIQNIFENLFTHDNCRTRTFVGNHEQAVHWLTRGLKERDLQPGLKNSVPSVDTVGPVAQFLEEALTIFNEHNIAVPESYRKAAEIVFFD